MLLTHKIRIYPDSTQETVLRALSEKCRLIYNFALKERKENWEANRDKPKGEKTWIGYTDQHNDLPRIKKTWPEYVRAG